MANFLLINYEYPPIGGGAASATRNLALALRGRGHRVVVLTSAFQRLRGRAIEDDIEVIRLPVGRKELHRGTLLQMFTFVTVSTWRVRSIARHHSIDRVIAFFSIPSGIAAWWLNRRTKIPYAVSLRGGDVPGTESGLRLFYWFLGPLRRRILKEAISVTAPGSGLKELSEERDRIPVLVIPNGIDTSIYRPEKGRDLTEIVLLSVGRLHPQKTPIRILEIVRAIRLNCSLPARALIIGDGPERACLEQYVREQQLGAAAKFTGWLDRSEVALAYRSATFLVQLSSYEGMSNVVLEALASGLPVVASRIPGNLDLVFDQENGLLFSSDESCEVIAAEIVRLWKSPARWQRMSNSARISVTAKYDWPVIATSYEQLFDRRALLAAQNGKD
ncbi:MAG TPA: glycosyltransferase family 4 protein [Chthoniobacterales bacterium]|nr:glycosyltransferase family 4 protein [Chthoniobacterales bacterium]